eukprot:13180255-Alexandrium_andersonii.AAC.1
MWRPRQRQFRGLQWGLARPPRVARGRGGRGPRAGPSRRLLAADRPHPRLVRWAPTTGCRTPASR